MPRRCLTLACVAAAAVAADAQRTPSLDTVLERFRTYLTTYSQAYSATVATEHYEQDVFVERARLVSEFAMVRPPGSDEWLGFRDVLSVNDKDVTGRPGRLAALFANPAGLSLGMASRIAEESARFNIGRVRRTVNNPAIVLEVLAPRHHVQFRWSNGGDDRVGTIRARIVRAVEQSRPTIVRSRDGRDEPVDARIWIDPANGTLLRTALQITVSELYSESLRLDVTFAADPQLLMWVPVRMEELYQIGTRDVQRGSARYSGYRQFVVQS